ncbi:hypothetical protein ES708_21124 [subsurface metagenome]
MGRGSDHGLLVGFHLADDLLVDFPGFDYILECGIILEFWCVLGNDIFELFIGPFFFLLEMTRAIVIRAFLLNIYQLDIGFMLCREKQGKINSLQRILREINWDDNVLHDDAC